MSSPLSFVKGLSTALIVLGLTIAATPASAQTRDVDPGAALDAQALPVEDSTTVVDDVIPADSSASADTTNRAVTANDGAPVAPSGKTYRKDDLIAGAEGAFGKGTKGLAKMIESVLSDQGEPNAYIAGREASGAIIVGLRYGSGTMSHAVEGQRPVYWTGPSIGFDLGGDAANVFALVYNLYDSQELYRRYPQVEGRAYYVGGLSATYLRRGNIVIIPIRLGVGLRAGINAGYMKFSEKNKWMPF